MLTTFTASGGNITFTDAGFLNVHLRYQVLELLVLLTEP